MIGLQESGYIKGPIVMKLMGEKYSHIRGGVFLNITLKGVEFLKSSE